MTGEGAPECDPPLTDIGQRQAQAAAKALEWHKPNVIISSGMRRADQTAEATAKHFGLNVIIDNRFAEIDYGGRPYVNGHMMRARGKQAWEAFLRNPIAEMGGNEAELKTRLQQAVASLFLQYPGKDQVVAVFCHAFPIGLVVTASLGAPAGSWLARYNPAFCSLTCLVGDAPERLFMKTFGEAQHVAPYPPLT